MKKNIFLILIIVLAFVLRFYKLNTYPALNADEAAIGYNAYSLLQTGLDEHGNPWPIHFQSFNDYKPGFYFYMVLPFVKVLGLNVWAVRIPGALCGVLTVLVLYYLVEELFIDHESPTTNHFFPLAAAALLAISPWHIQFSRGGWEVNVATFFIATGLLFFLKAIKKPSFLNFAFCILPFVLSLYTYHAARVVVPLLGLSLLVIYRKDIKVNIKTFVIAAFIGLILLVPLARDLTKGSVSSRVMGVGLFADSGPLNRINEQRGEHTDFTGIIPKLIHNKAVNYTLAFMENWSQHYWGEFLFLSGDAIQRNAVPETGQMYIFDLLFLAVGIIAIVRSKEHKRSWLIVIIWLLIAPIPAALTFQSPNALRAQNMVIPLVIISAYGLVTILEWIKRVSSRKLILTFKFLIFILISWQFARYLHMYYVHMAKEYPFSSQYGVKELVDYVKGVEGKYNKIIVTNRYDQPYILFLFYLQYPPQQFQGNHVLTPKNQFGFSTVDHFDKYYFQAIKYDEVRPDNPNSLIIGTKDEIPKEANIIKKIYGTNGYEYFDIVAN
jgi:4-amino-4-deoxy-L-arabinose transferase-like glycosyltransferase